MLPSRIKVVFWLALSAILFLHAFKIFDFISPESSLLWLGFGPETLSAWGILVLTGIIIFWVFAIWNVIYFLILWRKIQANKPLSLERPVYEIVNNWFKLFLEKFTSGARAGGISAILSTILFLVLFNLGLLQCVQCTPNSIPIEAFSSDEWLFLFGATISFLFSYKNFRH